MAPPRVIYDADRKKMTFFVLRQVHPLDGKFLSWFDPEWDRGRGGDKWTTDVRKAIWFESFEAALACWRQQSKAMPLRDDGKPNRPLTAYSVTVQEVDATRSHAGPCDCGAAG